MNPGLVVKLRPAGPWRIGPDSGARNRVDVIYHSDSLYSAVTSAMSRMGLLDAWLDATARSEAPAVSFSSCFPFLGDLAFVVPPRTLWPPTTPAAMSGRVRWKSARFIPLTMVESILSGRKLNENQWSVDGASGCLVPAGKPGPFRTNVRWNAAVDRLSGASERHGTACIEFREGSGLWTVVGFRDEAARDQWQEQVKAAFRLLADTGFGGERSRGWGRAETPEFVAGMLPGLIIEYKKRAGTPAAPVEEPEEEEEPPVQEPPEDEPASAPVPPVEEGSANAELAAALEAALETAAAEGEIAAAPAVDAVPEGDAAEVLAAAPEVTAADAEGAVAEAVESAEERLAEPAEAETAPETAAVVEGSASEGIAAPEVAEAAPAESDAVEEDSAPSPSFARMRDEGVPRDPGGPPHEPVMEVSEAPLAEAALEGAITETAEAAPETTPEAGVVESVPTEERASLATPEASVRAPRGGAPMRVEPEPEIITTPPVPSNLTAHWLLSLFTPAAGDAVDWGRGNYTVLARGGRIESPAAGSGELKKQVQMVAEGSVLYSDGMPQGAVADVAPDGFAHPVFRAGFALAIPLPEVH